MLYICIFHPLVRLLCWQPCAKGSNDSGCRFMLRGIAAGKAEHSNTFAAPQSSSRFTDPFPSSCLCVSSVNSLGKPCEQMCQPSSLLGAVSCPPDGFLGINSGKTAVKAGWDGGAPQTGGVTSHRYSELRSAP